MTASFVCGTDCGRPQLPPATTIPAWTCIWCGHGHQRDSPCDFVHLHQVAVGTTIPITCECLFGATLSPLADTRRRRSIAAATRLAVIIRDGGMCWQCGRTCLVGKRALRRPARRLTLDHIQPWSLGGGDEAENLRVACQSCNSRRGNKTPPPSKNRAEGERDTGARSSLGPGESHAVSGGER